jgi:hypothetical protein
LRFLFIANMLAACVESCSVDVFCVCVRESSKDCRRPEIFSWRPCYSIISLPKAAPPSPI